MEKSTGNDYCESREMLLIDRLSDDMDLKIVVLVQKGPCWEGWKWMNQIYVQFTLSPLIRVGWTRYLNPLQSYDDSNPFMANDTDHVI